MQNINRQVNDLNSNSYTSDFTKAQDITICRPVDDDDDLRFYVVFDSISVISGRCLDDNERLCARKLRLRLRRFHLE